MATLHHYSSIADQAVIGTARKMRVGLTRGSLFLVFFWFGALKVVNASPAQPLVLDLLHKTIPFMDPQTFMVLFGLFEMLIGIMFLFHSLERVVVGALCVHMFTTFMPLVLLPGVTWQAPFVPTLEGQYIIKNVVIIALAARMVARLHPKTHPDEAPTPKKKRSRP